jgi:hypothetical protein
MSGPGPANAKKQSGGQLRMPDGRISTVKIAHQDA